MAPSHGPCVERRVVAGLSRGGGFEYAGDTRAAGVGLHETRERVVDDEWLAALIDLRLAVLGQRRVPEPRLRMIGDPRADGSRTPRRSIRRLTRLKR